LRNFLFRMVFKAAVKGAAKILTTSQFNRDEISKYYKVDPKKISVVSASTGDWSELKPTPQEVDQVLTKFELTKEQYILSLSTLNPRKNIETLLEAYAKFLKANSDSKMKLVIAGKKGWKYDSIFELYEKLQQENPELKLDKSILFTDYISDLEANVLARSCKMLVYPSLYEGFGLPALEALLLDVEVILSDIPVFTESFSGYAHFFPAADAEKLAETMQKVAKGEKLNNTKKQAELRQKFAWDKVATNLIDDILEYAKHPKTT
jgi:glycosyltransferase involved in cell wall biosynthesis